MIRTEAWAQNTTVGKPRASGDDPPDPDTDTEATE